MKKISVIVPVYNMEDKIKRCLDSLVNQTYKNIEIIVINDGSKDNSIKIINEYNKKYKNIIVVDRENKGISKTRNEGIKLATGDYIAFVDSDDYVELDMYEKLYNKMLEEDSDIVLCNYVKFNDKLEKEYVKIDEKCKITNLYDNPKMVYMIDYGPCNKLFKRELWHNIEFPIDLKYEDLEAVLKVFLKTKKISYSSEYLYNYYTNEQGQTNILDEKIYDIFKILDNLDETFKEKPKELKKAYQELCISKMFIYSSLLIHSKTNVDINEFNSKIYSFINSKFKHWKFNYLIRSRNYKNLILRTINLNSKVYSIYIKLRKEK